MEFSTVNRILSFALVTVAALAAIFVFGDVKQYWIYLLAFFVAGVIFILPLKYTFYAYFAYLFFDGAFKINSNYNPIVHIGQDLLLGVLLLRSIFDQASGTIWKFQKTPYFKFVCLFLIWIGLQYLNPFGLGFLPSLAGTKIYVSMIFFFFLAYHHLSREDFQGLFVWLLFLITLQSIICIVEFLYGQEWVLNLHPRYKSTAGTRFVGVFYRPFGTTSVPGGPAVWISMGAPIAAYLLLKAKAKVFPIVLSILFLVSAAPALTFCQVRTAMVFFAGTALAVAFFPGKDFRIRIARLGMILAAGAVVLSPYISREMGGGFAGIQGSLLVNLMPAGAQINPMQVAILKNRLETLGSAETYTKARTGALGDMFELSQYTIFGIGLSRVGAASAPWQDLIKKDPHFGLRWAFSDNLYKAIFTELGILGLFSWLLMVGAIVFALFKGSFRHLERDQFLMWTCGVGALSLLVGGIGNEGILYAPVSCFFWTFLAVGLKEAKHASV